MLSRYFANNLRPFTTAISGRVAFCERAWCNPGHSRRTQFECLPIAIDSEIRQDCGVARVTNKQRPIILPREVNQPRVMSDSKLGWLTALAYRKVAPRNLVVGAQLHAAL